jgi:predicted NAD/FAD-dependent oxidoreductase
MQYDVIIIGGGLAGLTSAYYLNKNGHKIKVIEKEKAIGGRTRTINLDNNQIVPFGAEFFTPDYKNIIQLSKELGVKLVPAYQLYKVNFEGKDWQFGYKEFVQWVNEIGIVRAIGMLKNLPLIFRIFTNSKYDLQNLVRLEKRNLHKFVDDLLLPKEMVELIAAVNRLTFHYANGLNEISAGYLINWLRNVISGRYLIPEGGIDQLAKTLSEKLDVQNESEVQGIRNINGIWEINLGNEVLHAKKVIVATPGNIATVLLSDYVKDISEINNLISNTKYSRMRRLFIETESPVGEARSVYVQSGKDNPIEYITQQSDNLIIVKLNHNKFDEEVTLEDLKSWTKQDNLKNIIHDLKISNALPIYDVDHINRVLNYLESSKQIAKEYNLVLAGDYLFGPYTDSAVYSGVKAYELLKDT